MKNIGLLILAIIFGIGFTPADHPITVYLIGDSTMSEKRITAYPETGWGMPFKYYFKETVRVENHARNGRSTRTFFEEGRWEPVLESMKEGDYVFIQFGHNDENPTKSRYTTPDDYQMYLRKYVTETRENGGQPVLMTPVSRRKFIDGKQVETHEEYSALVRKVANELSVPFIDMDILSQQLYNSVGEDKSTLLFLQLQPGQNPNYPNGITDNTHFSETGARMIAELVLSAIAELELDLANHIIEGED